MKRAAQQPSDPTLIDMMNAIREMMGLTPIAAATSRNGASK